MYIFIGVLSSIEMFGYNDALLCTVSSPFFPSTSTEEAAQLEFVSGMTRDILSRGILSSSAMALLFSAHVERHKHHLTEVRYTIIGVRIIVT